MSSYLDHYGEGDARREKITKRIVLAALAVAAAVGGTYFALLNHSEKARVEQFARLLQNKDYKGAYAMWGCTDAKPCADYRFEKFMEDWGPSSKLAQVPSFEITRTRSCGTGVIVSVNFGGRDEKFWVEKKDLTIGFSPWPVCPPQ
jgi:hypothetical protein